MNNDQEANKNRILKAAQEILAQTDDIDKITVRQIAERAEVGIGLINYHFQSKDNLMSAAIGDVMTHMAGGFALPGDLPPVQKLKTMLKTLCMYARKYEKLLQFAISRNFQNGVTDAQLLLVPVLREIFGGKKDEMQLRVLALQVLLPLQVPILCPSEFRKYSGVDLYDDIQRNNYIDTLVDNITKQ